MLSQYCLQQTFPRMRLVSQFLTLFWRPEICCISQEEQFIRFVYCFSEPGVEAKGLIDAEGQILLFWMSRAIFPNSGRHFLVVNDLETVGRWCEHSMHIWSFLFWLWAIEVFIFSFNEQVILCSKCSFAEVVCIISQLKNASELYPKCHLRHVIACT